MTITYRVARGTIKLPRDPKSDRKFNTAADFVRQGDVLPDGLFAPEALKTLMREGRIEPITAAKASEVSAQIKMRGKWSVDPTALVGKTLEDLLVMALEIDPDFDVSELVTEADAVRQLTADWDPAFRDEVTRSTDRSRPEQLKLRKSESGREVRSNTTDAGSRPMSQAAEQALARAKERAQAEKTPTTEAPAADAQG